jgi:hypothetical protein
MVEYKKKKLILQSGGTRNYYYKVSSDGKKKQVSKNEYLEKKGGTNNKNKENNERRLSLMQSFNNLSNHINNSNSKKILSNQILLKLKFTNLNSILEFISTILKKKTLEKPSVKLILNNLVEEFKKNWSEYISKFYDEIKALNTNDTISLLERLLNFGIEYREYFFKDEYVSFIIMKLIRQIYFRIRRGEIIVPDTFKFKGVFDAVLHTSSQWNNNNAKPSTDNNISDPFNRFAKHLLRSCYNNSSAPQNQ